VKQRILYKALLSLGTGAVDERAGTRHPNKLGGLVRNMPWTAGAFLVGSLAISARPPFNGRTCMDKIRSIAASEMLDSRGRPTVGVIVTLHNRMTAMASVPAGASIGKLEACELRDHDLKRYLGQGMKRAAASVNEIIAPRPTRESASDQRRLDGLLRELDGTTEESKLGAHAILGVSLAMARVAAQVLEKPLYWHLRELAGLEAEEPWGAAYSADEHPERQSSRWEQRGFPGVHDLSRRRPDFCRRAALRDEDFPHTGASAG